MTRISLAAVVCALAAASGASAQPLDPVRQAAALTVAHHGPHDELGWSVAVSGNTVVVGVPFHGRGEALVYVRPPGGWTGRRRPSARLIAPAGSERFGWSVAISGRTIVVGSPGHFQEPGIHPAGNAYVFVRPGARWSGTRGPSASLVPSTRAAGDVLGESVGVDGNTIVVGATGHGKGAAFVFTKPRGGWAGVRRQATTLAPSDGRKLDLFGNSVAIAGTTVAVAAPQHRISRLLVGQAYVFVPRGSWRSTRSETAKLRTSLHVGGSGVSVAASRDIVAVGSGQADNSGRYGQAFVYQRPAAGWSGTRMETARLRVPERAAAGTCGVPGEVGAAQSFGKAIAISGDRIVAGAGPHGIEGHHFLGKACVFTKPATGWAGTLTEAATLTPAGGAEGDLFASAGSPTAVAVSGATIVAGAPLRHKGKGQAYVY
jgi:FG-GAP repeat protein